jgi:hypothetical protein
MDSDTQRALAGWNAFVKFITWSTAATALTLILMAIFLV